MTVVVGWIREINDAQELIIASDSRLCGGYRWDNCPKILTFPRNDCAIAFAGEVGYAYPLMMQAYFASGETYQALLKRIIAIGGDVVSCKYGQLYVNGQKISESDHTVGKTSDIPAQTVPDGSVYLLGDNREHSMDSRSFGCMSCEDIIGKVVH